MSLSLAFSSALSGLRVASRGTQLVADNIANVQTVGYGVRTLDQSARMVGPTGNGVQALNVQRDVDQGLLSERRNAVSLASRQSALADFWRELERNFGMPDEVGSLVHRIGALEDALSRATAAPESDINLLQVANAARDIVRNVRTLQSGLIDQRERADSQIARDVGNLNLALEETARLNREIQRQTLLGGAPQALMDIRQALIDQVSEIIPVTELPREHGRILLLAKDGTVLSDLQSAIFAFSPTPVFGPTDFVEDGNLSQLSVNGRTVSPTGALLSEGRLGAAFAVRDQLAPAMQAELDALTTDLVSRFMSPGADPTLPPGAFGLFQIDGEATLPALSVGISGRLNLNPLVDPEASGQLWRLRSGLYALAAGPVSDNAQVTRLLAALREAAPIGMAGIVSRSLHGHATDAISRLSAERLTAEIQIDSTNARVSALEDAFNAGGVDTDAELSKLLRLEQAYAANARVLSTLDAMLRTVLEI